ncbi:MAG: hypothetical protein LQ342_008203 [Letrouitia transgressa]|nr:MAG: hypothetical protein LQ342_008203 [Letrouitia transgressa]
MILGSLLLSVASAQLAASLVAKGRPLEAVACSSDSSAQNPVIAWPGNACGEDPDDTIIGSSLKELKDKPLSCTSTPHNTKCFPIALHSQSSYNTKLELRDTKAYKNRPIRQAPEQQILGDGARSISLRWPDEMRHAVFFTDEACHDVQSGRPEFTWHVQRTRTQVAQCESPPAGLFKSVEFMRQEEYEIFSRRMRGQDEGVEKTKWRGVF